MPVSIHVPLAEHDIANPLDDRQTLSFNSRAPRGARPNANRFFAPVKVSIHVPLAEHDALLRASPALDGVSIHVPLAEHDVPASAGQDYQ